MDISTNYNNVATEFIPVFDEYFRMNAPAISTENTKKLRDTVDSCIKYISDLREAVVQHIELLKYWDSQIDDTDDGPIMDSVERINKLCYEGQKAAIVCDECTAISHSYNMAARWAGAQHYIIYNKINIAEATETATLNKGLDFPFDWKLKIRYIVSESAVKEDQNK